MWWMLLVAAYAQPIRLCTDAGALVGEESADGTLSGVFSGGMAASGTRDAFVIQYADGKPRWTGPLSDLHPRDPRDLVPEDDTTTKVLGFFETTGDPLGCPVAGPSTVLIGRWPTLVSLPKGSWVAAMTDSAVLVRSPEGVGWLRDVAMGPALAADVAAEMKQWLPDHTTAVVARNGRALVIATQGMVVEAGDPVTPAPIADLDVLPLLRPPRALVDGQRPARVIPSAVGSTREMLVEVNAFRSAANLPPYESDGWLNWTALAHCAYLEWAVRAGRPVGHYQDADSPVFYGDTPAIRSGGAEVVAFDRSLFPWESVESWIQTPFHRSPLLDPRPGGIGACATAGARVIEVTPDKGVPVAFFAYPIQGQKGVPLAFDGLEAPDPVPFPDRAAPMGFPLTMWLRVDPALLVSAEAWLRDDTGADVPHWFITPSNHPHLADAPEAEVHLIPKVPLVPGRTYTWGVRWGLVKPVTRKDPSGVSPFEWSGTFTTVAEVVGPTPVAPAGVAGRLATALADKRAALGLGALALEHDATLAAALAIDSATESVGGVLQAERIAYGCWTDSQAETLITSGKWPDGLLDPALTRVGFRAAKSRTCAVAASPMLRPPKWDPRASVP